MYNCSLVEYDPYTKTSTAIDIPGLTQHGVIEYTDFHLNGIDFDPASGHIHIAAASTTAFDSFLTGDYAHANYTGPNRVLAYDPATRAFVADADLHAAQTAFRRAATPRGQRTSGFQDVAADTAGNVFAIGTFGNSVVRIAAGTSEARLWFQPRRYTKEYGFGGIFAAGDKLVVSDTLTKGFVTFDATEEEPVPTRVAIRDLPAGYQPTADGLYAPPKYGGKIALWSDDFNGTAVYGSEDGWSSARYLGPVENDFNATKGGLATATFEMAGSIYQLVQFFQAKLPVKTKESFPFMDITKKVDEVVKKSGICL
jgi:hypothetical protein